MQEQPEHSAEHEKILSAAELPNERDLLPEGPVRPAVRKSMQGNKRRDTKPEMVVRRMLREMGYPGYRLDWKKAPGHPDIAYPGRKIAIFVHGCFWHRCPTCNLSVPKSNEPYWRAKFARNIARDERTQRSLEDAGWKVVIVWEHQLKKKAIPETQQFLYEMVRLPDTPEIWSAAEPVEQESPQETPVERDTANGNEKETS